MGNVASAMLALLLLQVAAAAGWALAARLGPLRRAGAHWCAFAVGAAGALALALARDSGLPASVDLSSGVAVAALLVLRRGLRIYLRQSAGDGEAGVVLALVVAGSALAQLLPAADDGEWRIAVNAVAVAWVFARIAGQAWPALRAEFGERHAFLIIAPFVAGAALFMVRLAVLALPSAQATLLPAESSFNLALVTLLLLLGVVVHGSLASIVVLRALQRLRELSQRDALTGLLNRREWLRRLTAQHRWLARYGEPFSVLMVDIDHFKSINDTLGHAAGDVVLATLARWLVAGAREIDAVGRVGGEEFCLLLPRTEAAAARRTAERLRQSIADAELRWREHTIRLTVSIGVAVAEDADEPPLALLERTDRALYDAKRAGRNRTATARAPSPSPVPPAEAAAEPMPSEDAR